MTSKLKITDLRPDLSVNSIRGLKYSKEDIKWYFRRDIEYFKKIGAL